MATSGDYRSYHAVDGNLLTHILDPRTGRPLTHRGASVTVLAEACIDADGIATALFVMGPEEGSKWCDAHEVAALFQQGGADKDAHISRRETRRFVEVVGHE